MKVYIVIESATYYEFDITPPQLHGVFTSREIAETITEQHGGEIIEVELDATTTKIYLFT